MTMIRLEVTYPCETWTLPIQDINNLLVCKRQTQRKISEPVQFKEGWRLRNDTELQKMIEEESTNNKMVGTF